MSKFVKCNEIRLSEDNDKGEQVAQNSAPATKEKDDIDWAEKSNNINTIISSMNKYNLPSDEMLEKMLVNASNMKSDKADKYIKKQLGNYSEGLEGISLLVKKLKEELYV